jgi:hypothetical protein
VYTAKDPQNEMQSSTAIVEAVGTYLFGIYHVVIIIVLINMLIAMMSHSFEDIQVLSIGNSKVNVIRAPRLYFKNKVYIPNRYVPTASTMAVLLCISF